MCHRCAEPETLGHNLCPKLRVRAAPPQAVSFQPGLVAVVELVRAGRGHAEDANRVRSLALKLRSILLIIDGGDALDLLNISSAEVLPPISAGTRITKPRRERG